MLLELLLQFFIGKIRCQERLRKSHMNVSMHTIIVKVGFALEKIKVRSEFGGVNYCYREPFPLRGKDVVFNDEVSHIIRAQFRFVGCACQRYF